MLSKLIKGIRTCVPVCLLHRMRFESALTKRSNLFYIANSTARSISQNVEEPDSRTSVSSSEKNEPEEWLKSHPKALVKIGQLQSQLNHLEMAAVKIYVIPYLRIKFELLQSVWNTDKENSPNFDALDLSGTSFADRDLDTNTHANYKRNSTEWDQILHSSSHPTAVSFKEALVLKFPGVNLQLIAKELGLSIALLNNAKHGVIATDPDLSMLLTPDNVVSSLKRWKSLTGPFSLNIVKTFEECTT